MARFRCVDCANFKGKWGVNGCGKGCTADPRIGSYFYDGYKSTMAGCVMFERREEVAVIKEPQEVSVA